MADQAQRPAALQRPERTHPAAPPSAAPQGTEAPARRPRKAKVPMVSYTTRIPFDLQQRLDQYVREHEDEGAIKQDVNIAALREWLDRNGG